MAWGKATLRVMAEELTAKGWSAREISDHLGMAHDYARHIANVVNHTESSHDPSRPTAEDDERHVDRCLAEGGFPAAVIFRRGTVWLSHDGRLWRHVKPKMRRPNDIFGNINPANLASLAK